MTLARYSLILLLTLLVTACASTPSEDEVAAAAEAQAAQERAAVEADLEAQRQREEQLLTAERAREATARAEVARQAAAEAERQQQAEAARVREEREGPSVEERAQIAANQTETTNLESANATLLQAITAAEDLVQTLTEEQDKYASTDPATGATTQALSKERIDELNAELERLQNQAAALSQQP